MSSNKSISVTIPNYNGKVLLKKNLPPLYQALNRQGKDYEIIVADDASTDGSVQYLKENYPEIILIEHSINQGFSKNINSAIKKATKDLVLLLNTDVELTKDYFEHLVPWFNDSTIFGVMGKVIGQEDGQVQDAAKYPTIGMISIRSNINYLIDDHSGLPTLFLSGGYSLIDRQKLNELQGFDEIFSPFYAEDVDLSLRAWRLGYKCYFEPRAICKHPISSTISKLKKDRVKMMAKRNKMLVHFIHLDGFHLFLYLTLLTAKVPFRLLILDLNYVKAYLQFLEKIPKAIQSKKQIKELQKSKKTFKSIRDVKLEIISLIGDVKVEKF